MELALIRSTTLERAMRRLRTFNPISPAMVEAPVNWRIRPTIARDRGDYLLHTILGR